MTDLVLYTLLAVAWLLTAVLIGRYIYSRALSVGTQVKLGFVILLVGYGLGVLILVLGIMHL